MRKRIVFSVAALIAVLATPGCKESTTTPSTTTPPEFEPGPLGAVTLEAGEAVRIRMLLSITVAPSLGARVPARDRVRRRGHGSRSRAPGQPGRSG